MKFSNDKMKDCDNEEGYMNQDTGPPPKGTSLTEEAKNKDESCEEGYAMMTWVLLKRSIVV